METERRTFEIASVEVRQLEGAAPVITGYAAVFNSWSEVIVDRRGRRFRERIAPTAFDRSLESGRDVRALWNHDSAKPLGRTRTGTLRINKDGKGIRFEIDAPSTSWGVDALESIRRGDVSGSSFSFEIRRDGGDTWARGGADGIAEHTLLDVDLFEVSPVTEPAYPATSVYLRSVPDFDESDGQEAGEIDAAQEGQAAQQAQVRERRLRLLALNIETRRQR